MIFFVPRMRFVTFRNTRFNTGHFERHYNRLTQIMLNRNTFLRLLSLFYVIEHIYLNFAT